MGARDRGPGLAAPIAVVLAFAAFVALPWHAVADRSVWQAMALVFSSGDAASGAFLALVDRSAWLWTIAPALALSAAAAMLKPGKLQGSLLTTSGILGVTAIVAASFAPGTLRGFGAGSASTLAIFSMLFAFGLARRGMFSGDLFVAAAVVASTALLTLFIAYPIMRTLAGAFADESGGIGIATAWSRIANDRIFGLGCLSSETRCGVAWNTLFLATATASSTTCLGALLALLAARGNRALARPLNALALLPVITPPFVVGLGLILLFGRAGLVNRLLEHGFGIEPTRWFYGWFGVWIAQTFAFAPIAFMIMRGMVQGLSPTLEEAAQTLRANANRTFFTITLALLKPGIANAFLVGFIESMADFGNPIVVGGSFSVLSTEIFFAIVGAQYDQGRAAGLALLLAAFALVAYAAQRAALGRATYITVGARGDAGLPMPLPRAVERVTKAITLPWLAFTLIVYVIAFAGGFVRIWGRDYTPTLEHFRSAFGLEWSASGIEWTGSAWNSFFTTLKLALIASPLTAIAGLLLAWLISRNTFRGQATFEFAGLLAFAIPGTVLGVSYLTAFNAPPLELTGSAAIIVLCFVFRNLPVGVRAGTAAFKQLDRSLDEASAMLRATSVLTLRHIVLPLLKPAVVAALVYSFVRSVTTVSAVIFLVTAENELATTYIIGRVSNGDYGAALAYCTVLIVAMSLAITAVHFLAGERRLGRRARATAQIAAEAT